MMGYVLASFAAVYCFCFFMFLLFSGQTNKARIKRRLYSMQMEVREERAKHQDELPDTDDKMEVRRYDERSLYERVIQPIISGLSSRLSHIAPAELMQILENQIFRAGKQDSWSVNYLAAGWVLSVTAGFLLALFFVSVKQGLLYPQRIIIFIFGIAGGAFLPFFILQSIINNRKAVLRRHLPEFIDLVCVSVQAGLSFDGAVAKITERMKGPLSDEFIHMQRDMRHGMTKQRSLMQLAKRCDIEEMYLFTTSVIQADKLGTSMSKTLKMQADNMRDRYRQLVKAEAMKAPVKIIFPMVIFIFPSIFVIVLLPIALTLFGSFGK